MRILLVSPLAPPVGGMATWTQVYCDYCRNAGSDVQVINTALIGRRKENSHARFFWDEAVRNISIVGKFFKKIRKESFDVVHINSACSPYGLLRDMLCVFFARKRKIIFHCHCNVKDQIGNSKAARTMLAMILKRVEQILVLNRTSYDFLLQFRCKDIRIVPNFVEKDVLAEDHIIRGEATNFLYVGHIQKTKGLLEIIESAKLLPDKKFNLVGPVYEDIDAWDIPANIHFFGVKSKREVQELLCDADVFLFPSHTEGFSVALLEAMACGLPVIATDVGANSEMLEDMGGLVIPPRSSEAIVAAVKEIQDPQLRQRMSAWNIQKVWKCYTVDAVMRDMLAQWEI